jgi:hypothetical protein
MNLSKKKRWYAKWAAEEALVREIEQRLEGMPEGRLEVTKFLESFAAARPSLLGETMVGIIREKLDSARQLRRLMPVQQLPRSK